MGESNWKSVRAKKFAHVCSMSNPLPGTYLWYVKRYYLDGVPVTVADQNYLWIWSESIVDLQRPNPFWTAQLLLRCARCARRNRCTCSRHGRYPIGKDAQLSWNDVLVLYLHSAVIKKLFSVSEWTFFLGIAKAFDITWYDNVCVCAY